MAIRKYTSYINKGTATVKGIRIPPTASAFSRTICNCGFYSDKQVYECPECGNTEFSVLSNYQSIIGTEPVTMTVSKGTVDISFVQHNAFLRKDVELEDSVVTMLHYDESKGELSTNVPYNREKEIYTQLVENKDKLPTALAESVEICVSMGFDSLRYLRDAMKPHPHLEQFIRLERDNYPNLCKALTQQVFSYGGGYGGWGSSKKAEDIDFNSVTEFMRKYRIPDEFEEYLDKYPSEMLSRTTEPRLFSWSRNPHANFRAPENWDSVPVEIKNVLKYYLENGILNIHTFFDLGRITPALLKKPVILNSYLKKYLMQWTDRIISQVNDDYNYLVKNGIDVTEATFDSKWINQNKNVAMLKETLARNESDIDDFINYMDVDAVGAVIRLSQTKRKKRAKSETT